MQAALGSGDSAREAQLLETWKAYKKGFQQGIALFNVKPKKGIAYLQVDPLLGLELLPSDHSTSYQFVRSLVTYAPTERGSPSVTQTSASSASVILDCGVLRHSRGVWVSCCEPAWP